MKATIHEWIGRGVVKGTAVGPAIVSQTAFSFLGDVDIVSGYVVGKSSDLFGRSIKGHVLIVPSTRGSAGAWRFLYQLKVHGTHPIAIVTQELPDPSVVQGAIMTDIPIVVVPNLRIHEEIAQSSILNVNGHSGVVARTES
jgi:uncharacterized protein